MRPRWSSRFVCAVLAAGVTSLSASPVRAAVKLEPASVRIGAFFDGSRVHVSGPVPRGSDVVVEVLGKRKEQQLLRKGRHWDIWMTVGEIDVEHAPSVYFALSTDPAAFSATGHAAAFGYRELRRRIEFIGDKKGLERLELFREFFALKESEGLYGIYPGALKVSPASGGTPTVEGTFRIPSRIDPGVYRVRLSVVRDGRVVRTEEAKLEVRMVGLPAILTKLAREHGALHGLLCVFIAVVFGFLVGRVFKRGSGKH